MKTKEQFRLKMIKYFTNLQHQIIYHRFLDSIEKQQLLKLIQKMKNVIYDDIITEDIEGGEAWNKKDQ